MKESTILSSLVKNPTSLRKYGKNARMGWLIEELTDNNNQRQEMTYGERHLDALCRIIDNFFHYNKRYINEAAFEVNNNLKGMTVLTAVAAVKTDLSTTYITYRLPSSHVKNNDKKVKKILEKIEFVDHRINYIIDGINILCAVTKFQEDDYYKLGAIFGYIREFNTSSKAIDLRLYTDILKLIHYLTKDNSDIKHKILSGHQADSKDLHPERVLIKCLPTPDDDFVPRPIGKSQKLCYDCNEYAEKNGYLGSEVSNITYRNKVDKPSQKLKKIMHADQIPLVRQPSIDNYDDTEFFAPGVATLLEKFDLIRSLFVGSNRVRGEKKNLIDKTIYSIKELMLKLDDEPDTVHKIAVFKTEVYNLYTEAESKKFKRHIKVKSELKQFNEGLKYFREELSKLRNQEHNNNVEYQNHKYLIEGEYSVALNENYPNKKKKTSQAKMLEDLRAEIDQEQQEEANSTTQQYLKKPLRIKKMKIYDDSEDNLKERILSTTVPNIQSLKSEELKEAIKFGVEEFGINLEIIFTAAELNRLTGEEIDKIFLAQIPYLPYRYLPDGVQIIGAIKDSIQSDREPQQDQDIEYI